MFKRLKRYGYTTDYLTFSDLLDKADSDLFCNMRRSYHCLHHVLPPLRMVDNLRVRGHPYNLPECSTHALKKAHLLCVPCMALYKIYKFYYFLHHYICFVLFYCGFLFYLYCFSLLFHVTALFVCVCHTK